MTKIVAIIQARTDSTRFPKKVLADVLGKPMIAHLIERVKKSKLIDQLVLATTTRKIDDPITDVAKENKINIFRGNFEDVLDRYYKAAKKYQADIVVRITGDCPLIDPHIVDQVIQYFLENKYDYVTNTLEPTYPDGLDVEVFSFKALEIAWKEAQLLSEREHVTPYIVNHPEKFRISNVRNTADLSNLRWTVDRKEDLEFVKEIFKRLYKEKTMFHMQDILELLQKYPDLKEINAGIQRNEGYLSSLKKDKICKRSEKHGEK